ncbi:helix-turn-helix transcriptional regulator [Bordetella petrii]|uniref:helix-turn-helix transcriptional regulator n=1 Tax=Bordetella petrii TaxID=94624 RepID=UPI001A9691B9|nr:AlpA family transcriptional regulator [Bordetella petrii]MBO1110675.1 AlpA family transcriptional regulator [Bordetella petrii]
MTTPAAATPSRRLIRKPAVHHKTGIGHSAMYELISAGEFPAPVKIGTRAVAWVEEEIDAWIEARIQATRGIR